MEKKAKVQDYVHNYLKSKETTHPITHFHSNNELHQSDVAVTLSLTHYRTVGSVVLFHDTTNKTCFS